MICGYYFPGLRSESIYTEHKQAQKLEDILLFQNPTMNIIVMAIRLRADNAPNTILLFPLKDST